MVLIGVWPLLTNTMGIEMTDSILLVKNISRQNADVISRGRNDLINSYIREEIEVKFILNCLYAESKNQRTTEAHNIMATSVLKFISKIPGQSDMYTNPVFRSRIGQIWTQMTAFDEFIWALRNGRHKVCLVNSMKCVISKDATRCHRGTTTKNLRVHKEDDPHFGAWNTNVERKVDWTAFHSTKGVWT